VDRPDHQRAHPRPTHPIYRRLGDRVFQVVVVALGLSIIALALLLAEVLLVDGWEPLRASASSAS
jgi:hypothetical protein